MEHLFKRDWNKIQVVDCKTVKIKMLLVLSPILLWGAMSVAQTPLSLLENTPLSSEAPPFESINSVQAPSSRWSSADVPLPTNVWWQNLVLNAGTGVANSLPYIVQCSTNGLTGCMPGITAGTNYVISSFVSNWILGSEETVGAHKIVDYDPLSVTVRWNQAGSSTGYMEAPLVRGMPYLTAYYNGLTPEISTIHAVLNINGAGVNASVTGNRFVLELNNGQTWILYTSEATTFSVANNTLTAAGPINGSVRMAVLQGNGVSSSEALLDAHSSVVPVGGTVAATSLGNSAELIFNWEAEDMTGNATSAEALLVCALPHHLPVLQEMPVSNVAYTTIKGNMQAVIGGVWHMDEALTTIGFESPSGVAPSLEQNVRDALSEDANWPITAGDTYFGGKQLAAVGRLAAIADELGETSLAQNYRENLGNALHPWLNGTNGDPLRYDASWGGIITTSGGSFQQGLYNDHHFHYGYFVYAAAVMAKDHPEWTAQWGDEVMHLIRNLANPAASDPHYTYLRNKDWFVGHSWASGLFEFGDGRNQESTSEAVNAWYAVYLYGLATANDRLRDLGRLMLATEMRSTQTYWQVDSNDGIYPESFAANKVVGVLWSNKVDYGTFFGANTEFIHCIQMLPFTPISEELLEPSWIEEEYPILATALNNSGIGEGWKGFVYMAHAIIDPESAWDEIQTLTGYDDGNTKTNTLYWLATRPGAEDAIDGNGNGGDGDGGSGSDGVVFEVDLSEETLQGAVFITGSTLDDWCGSCIPMNDPDGDGIYTVTLDLAPGPIEYKFLNGSWNNAEIFDPAVSGSCTLTTGEFTNRYFVVPSSGNAEIGVVCFNSCDPCDSGVECASDTNNNGICDQDDIAGCTYDLAPNYSALATMDDGSCEWTVCPEPGCVGDVNNDNMISVGDLLIILGVFGNECG